MGRNFFTLVMLVTAGVAGAQDDSSFYDKPEDVKVGDIVILNEPSDPNYYRSVYFTFKAAKMVYPEVNADKYEKVYLSYKFMETPFTVTKIKRGIAQLGYGTIKNFAMMDLHLAFNSGEVGSGENISKTWLADELKPGDSITLLSPQNVNAYQFVSYTKEVAGDLGLPKRSNKALPAEFEGNGFMVSRIRRGEAIMGNDSIPNLAVAQLVKAIDANEIEVKENVTLMQETETRLDRITDTRPDNSIFGKLHIEPYIFPLLEVGPIEGSGNFVFGIGGGFVYRDKLQFGGYFHIPNRNHDKVFIDRQVLSRFNFDYSYGGLFFGYQLFQINYTRFFAEVKFGTGEASWDLENRQRTIDTDRFSVINPRIGLDYHITRHTIFSLMLGFRTTAGLDMTNLEAGALNGVTLSAALKIGRFR